MIGHAMAALSLILAQAASQPPPRPCLTPEQAGAGAAVALPEMVDMARRGCERHLPATTYLRAEGEALAQRWRTESAPHRPAAMAGLMRMLPPEARAAMAGQGTQPAAPEAMMAQVISGLEAGLAARLNPEICKEFSRLVEALAPLPAHNVAQLVSSTMGIGVRLEPPKGEDGPPICRQ